MEIALKHLEKCLNGKSGLAMELVTKGTGGSSLSGGLQALSTIFWNCVNVTIGQTFVLVRHYRLFQAKLENP